VEFKRLHIVCCTRRSGNLGGQTIWMYGVDCDAYPNREVCRPKSRSTRIEHLIHVVLVLRPFGLIGFSLSIFQLDNLVFQSSSFARRASVYMNPLTCYRRGMNPSLRRGRPRGYTMQVSWIGDLQTPRLKTSVALTLPRGVFPKKCVPFFTIPT
jgi:hypothetical protein